jgi:hypothetical protein
VRLHLSFLILIAALIAAGLASAGSDLRPGFERAACSPGPFPIDALTSPTGAQHGEHPSARALRKIIRDPSSEPYIEGRVPKHRWRLLRKSDRYVIYGAGDAERVSALSLKRTRHEGWAYANLDSGCRPRVLRSGIAASSWKLDREGAAPSPATTTLHLLVSETNCNDGQPPEKERILDPVVDYGRRGITITYFVEPPTGAHTCPGAPPAMVDLGLSEPLGDRVLRDGGSVVAQQRFPRPK